MKQVKRILVMITLCLSLSLIISATPAFVGNITVEASPKIKMSKTKATLVVGKSLQLKLKGSKGKVTWSSSKKSIATVSKNGKVKAKKKGTATITAKYQGKKYKCKITVKKAVPLKSISLNKKSLKLDICDNYEFKVKYNPSNATVKGKIKWTSSDEDVVEIIDEGWIYANKAGTATITATVDGKKAKCKVVVENTENVIESIQLNKTSLCLKAGTSENLIATTSPSITADKIKWSSDNQNIAEVDASGNVSAKKVGTCNITATCGYKKATCNVTVALPESIIKMKDFRPCGGTGHGDDYFVHVYEKNTEITNCSNTTSNLKIIANIKNLDYSDVEHVKFSYALINADGVIDIVRCEKDIKQGTSIDLPIEYHNMPIDIYYLIFSDYNQNWENISALVKYWIEEDNN